MISSDRDQRFSWEFISANDVSIPLGNCDINNGERLDVDFGLVNVNKITNNPPSITKQLNYKCEPGGDYPVVVKLISTASSFSSDYFSLSNDDLAFSVEYDDKIIRPNDYYNTNVTSGAGSDTLKFTLVKNKSADSISLGGFTGSLAVLVSLP